MYKFEYIIGKYIIAYDVFFAENFFLIYIHIHNGVHVYNGTHMQNEVRIAAHCNILNDDVNNVILCLQLTATHCCTLQHTALHCNTLTFQHTATHCNTLQDTARHCKTLQHTATMHCNTPAVDEDNDTD